MSEAKERVDGEASGGGGSGQSEHESRLFKIWGSNIRDEALFPTNTTHLNIVFDDSKNNTTVEGVSCRLDALTLANTPGASSSLHSSSAATTPHYKHQQRSIGPQYLNLESSVPGWRKPNPPPSNSDDKIPITNTAVNNNNNNNKDTPPASSSTSTVTSTAPSSWNSSFLPSSGAPQPPPPPPPQPHHQQQQQQRRLASEPHLPVSYPLHHHLYPPGYAIHPVTNMPYFAGEDVSDRQYVPAPDQWAYVYDSIPAAVYGHGGMMETSPPQPFLDHYFNYAHYHGSQHGAWIIPAHRRSVSLPDEQELQSLGSKTLQRASPVCKFFAQGHCARGETCTFAHVPMAKVSGFTGIKGQRPGLGSKLKIPVKNRSSSDGDVHVNDLSCKIASCSSVDEIVGLVYSLAKDQHGCRLLQRFIEEDPNSFDMIFTEAFDRINELMTDPFGNYLCQKLIDCCGDERRFMIVSKVSEDLVAISLNIHGTRVVQKLVEVITNPEEINTLVSALSQSVVTLTKDLNGNHVIQRCLHHLPACFNQFIYDSISAHCVSVATHKHGCCVLQRCIDYATESQRSQLISMIILNVLELVQDAFGNYVVQYILDLGEPPVSRAMMEKMLGSITNLAVQKFSSNVVEKCLELADPQIRDAMIVEICNEEKLPRLLQDPYANYVIQKALAVSDPNRFVELVEVLRPHVAALRSTAFGKRIQNKIVKRFPTLGSEGLPCRD